MPSATKPAPARATGWYPVPAGTKGTICKGSTCGALFYWIRDAKTGAARPIDCDVDGGVRPSEHANDPTQQSLFASAPGETHHDGRGRLHHETCPDVREFSHGGAR